MNKTMSNHLQTVKPLMGIKTTDIAHTMTISTISAKVPDFYSQKTVSKQILDNYNNILFLMN